jgi:hypothetical protein
VALGLNTLADSAELLPAVPVRQSRMAPSRRPSRFGRAAGIGAACGLALPVLGAIRLGLRAVTGRPVAAPSARDLMVLPLLVAAMALSGVILAALTPLRRSRAGAALAGLIAALPVAAGVGLMLPLVGTASGRSVFLGALTWAAIFGPIAGITWLRADPSDDPIASAVPRLRTVLPSKHRPPEA